MLVGCGNFQSISVCSLMFKLNFTSFVIVAPATIATVEDILERGTPCPKMCNLPVKNVTLC